MDASALRAAQQESAGSLLGSLFHACQRRYSASARLLEVDSPAARQVADCGFKSSVPLWPLLPAFEALCDRYRDAFYTAQISLLPEPDRAPDQAWYTYYHHVLLPHLLAEDALVRNVLRSLGALPCSSREAAASAVHQHFSEMQLPGNPAPWSPEERATNGG